MRWIFALIVCIVTGAAVVWGTPAYAYSVVRNPSTGSTPYAPDFSPSFNGHPNQVQYIGNTVVDENFNQMFRDTIPVTCGTGRHLTSLSFEFWITKITDGAGLGDNDAMAFWINGIPKYEMNVGAAAKAGNAEHYTLDMANLPAVGTGDRKS